MQASRLRMGYNRLDASSQHIVHAEFNGTCAEHLVIDSSCVPGRIGIGRGQRDLMRRQYLHLDLWAVRRRAVCIDLFQAKTVRARTQSFDPVLVLPLTPRRACPLDPPHISKRAILDVLHGEACVLLLRSRRPREHNVGPIASSFEGDEFDR